MVSIWVWCRALGNGHPVYNIHAQNPDGVTIYWKSCLPWYWKPLVPLVCFALTAVADHLTNWAWQSWGLPVGILLSFAVLHSGIFGTSTPLKLTTAKITDTDQITAILSATLVLFIQYGRNIPAVNESLRKMKFWDQNTHNQEAMVIGDL